MRSQDASLDSTQYRAVKTIAVDVVEMIETDMTNLGSQHPGALGGNLYTLPGGMPFGLVTVPDTTGPVRTFRFFAQTQRGAPPSIVRYRWSPVDSVTLSSGVTRPIFDFIRTVDGAEDGRSTGILTHLSFNLLEAPGNSITNVENTRQIFVELRAVPPFGEGRTIEETRWTSTFRPLALSITP
jgi:hypothetical protein